MNQNQDNPHKPLWTKLNQYGRERFVGTIAIEGVEHWITVIPNTAKRKDNQPSHHFRIDPKKPKP